MRFPPFSIPIFTWGSSSFCGSGLSGILCSVRNQNGLIEISHNTEMTRSERNQEKLTLLRLLLLLFDLIGYDGQLSLELGRRVSASKLVERLPGAPEGADKTVLQVGAHPGETLLQLWNTKRYIIKSTCMKKLFTCDWQRFLNQNQNQFLPFQHTVYLCREKLTNHIITHVFIFKI